ncbi:MAG: type II CAAX endopeptidase family protein [Spirochaetota bacterium]
MQAKNAFRTYLAYTFALFWILFLITGALVFLKAPAILQTIMKNVCAWASTFALILLFKKLYPGETFKDFLKRQFTPVNVWDFLIPLGIQVLIAAGAYAWLFSLTGESVRDVRFIKPAAILPLLLVNITSGPMGEELGWRAYALNEIGRKRSPLGASLVVGTLWGLWHFPLWLVSGYAGKELLIYSASFMLGILSFSVFLTFFYKRKRNILVAVWIHFLFNLFMQVVIHDDYRIIVLVSVLYLVVASTMVVLDRSMRQKGIQS